MKNKTTIALILIILGLVMGSSVYILKAEYALQTAIDKIESSNRLLKEANIKAETLSKIETIRASIDIQKSNNREFRQNKYQSEKVYNAGIWRLRCLEIQGTLELSGDEYELLCPIYSYDVLLGEWNESVFQYLLEYSSDNIYVTKGKLGLN